ncbi:MAG: hypothetical protein M0Z52_01455 [Actinomycetota bacterium]|nr:hypothetical protein [Actinomycetota bacterium]
MFVCVRFRHVFTSLTEFARAGAIASQALADVRTHSPLRETARFPGQGKPNGLQKQLFYPQEILKNPLFFSVQPEIRKPLILKHFTYFTVQIRSIFAL